MPSTPSIDRNSGLDLAVKIGTVLIAVALLVAGWTLIENGRIAVAREVLGHAWVWLYWPGLVMAIIVGLSYVYRTALWWRYRPIDGIAIGDDDLPTITVVIPAYNEGPMVRKSILSAVRSHYPPDKLQVICIDDGSRDDTHWHMESARLTAPDRITTLRFAQNRGKRAALYEGMQRAETDLIVTVDSDSLLPPKSLRHIVAPFVESDETGAVAGSVKVLNRYQTVITRMLGVRYILGFDYTRAYQSVLKTVFCCPGAFTAYRRSAIAPHLDDWLAQRFLGNACTNGDDHALTNAVLRAGFDTRYQGNAEVHTVVPHAYGPLTRMYTRWARSNIRESWLYLKFSLSRARARGDWLAWIDSVIHALHIPARLLLLPLSWLIVFSSGGVLIRSLAVATLLSCVYALYFLRSERSTESIYGVLYGWFAVLALQWVYPWAAFTVNRNSWLTRG